MWFIDSLECILKRRFAVMQEVENASDPMHQLFLMQP